MPITETHAEAQRTSETQRALSKLRNESQRYTPQDAPTVRLTFFGTQLARLTRDALYFGDLTGHTQAEAFVPKRIPLQGGRELVRLADDSLLVVTAQSTALFDAYGRPQGPLGKVTYFPGMRLWPELRFPRAFTTFEPNSGSFSLYRWDTPSPTDGTSAPRASVGPIFLPKTVTTLKGLANSTCSLLLDGSSACIKESTLYVGWPGQPVKRLGALEPGATVVRILPGDRSDRVRVLRSDARLEEYWVISPPKRLSSLSLPWMPFDVERLKGAFAVLQLNQSTSLEPQFSVTVIDTSGKPRWQKQLGSVPTYLSPTDFDREVLACRDLAVHPRKPWLAVSDCQSVAVFDVETGALLANLQDVRF